MAMTHAATRLRPTILAATLLVLFAPALARAQCTIKTSDFDKNGTVDMQLLGTNVNNENITVSVEPTQTTVTGCGTTKTFAGPFGSYLFKLNGGNPDTVTFNVEGTWVGMHKNVTVQGGLPVNKITIGGGGTLGPGSSLIVEVNTMSGTDTLAVVPPAMQGSYMDVRSNLGPGRDAVIVRLDNPITSGAVLQITSDLGGDNNIYRISQTALVNGNVNLNVIAGAGVDTGSLTLAGPFGANARFYYKTDLGAGNDGFDGQVDLGLFTVAAGGEVHLDVLGNAGVDNLSFSRNGSTGGPTSVMAGLLDVFLDGGADGDTINLDLGGGGFVTDGTLRVRENGGSGNDNLTCSIDVQPTSVTPNLDVVLLGGYGSDHLTSTINNDGPNAIDNYGPAGTALLDGGLDVGDVCTATGNGVVHKRNCES